MSCSHKSLDSRNEIFVRAQGPNNRNQVFVPEQGPSGTASGSIVEISGENLGITFKQYEDPNSYTLNSYSSNNSG